MAFVARGAVLARGSHSILNKIRLGKVQSTFVSRLSTRPEIEKADKNQLHSSKPGGLNDVKLTKMEKYTFVILRMFKNMEECPDRVSFSLLEKMKNLRRVCLNALTMVLFAVVLYGVSLSVKRDIRQGATLDGYIDEFKHKYKPEQDK